MDVIVDRCAGLDVHKNTVMVAVRKPDGVGGRSEVGVPGALAGVLLRDAEAVLVVPGIHTIARYPFALAAAGGAALFHGAFDRAEQLCQEALDAARVPSDELAGYTFSIRGNAAYALGDVGRAVAYLDRAAKCFRRVGDLSALAVCLYGLAIYRSRSGNVAVAAEEGQEALALARRTGNPGLTSAALAGLALVLVAPEPEQSRALIA